jgi:hypothetical protein
MLLPLLFAGGLGTAIALVTTLVEPGRSAPERWAVAGGLGLILAWILAAAVGVLALWLAALAEPPTALKHAPHRRWLAVGLLVGLVAAVRWLAVMAAHGHSYDALTWAVWLLLLGGPVVMGAAYLVFLLRS